MLLGAAAGRGPSPLQLLGVCLAFGCLVAGLHLFRPTLLARVDLAVYDRLLAASPLRAPSGRVALVEVDERTLAEAGRWPWPRDRVAALFDRVRTLGATAVGVDVLFAEPDAAGEASVESDMAAGGAPSSLSARDAALAATLGRGPYVLGYAFTFDRATDRPCHLRPIGVARAASRDAQAQVPRAVGALCSLLPLGAAAPSSGFINGSPDADGILRRMPQIVEFQGEIYPSLALAAVRLGLATQGLGLAESVGGVAHPLARRARDPYDALVSARVYKSALPHEEVVQTIVKGRGVHFDPDMVDAFLRIETEWRRIAIDFADEHDEPRPVENSGRLDAV